MLQVAPISRNPKVLIGQRFHIGAQFLWDNLGYRTLPYVVWHQGGAYRQVFQPPSSKAGLATCANIATWRTTKKMRLTMQDAQAATNELLDILKQFPDGVPTSYLSGTQRFHGERTLRNQQIIRLLRTIEQAEAYLSWQGNRTYYIWRLKAKRH